LKRAWIRLEDLPIAQTIGPAIANANNRNDCVSLRWWRRSETGAAREARQGSRHGA